MASIVKYRHSMMTEKFKQSADKNLPTGKVIGGICVYVS